MKLNSDFMWSVYLIGTAILFFYFGSLIGSSQTEQNLSRQMEESEEKINILNRENRQLSQQLTSRGIYSYPQAGIITGEQDDHLTLLIMLNGQEALKDLVVKRNIIPNYSQLTASEAEKVTPTTRSAYLGSLKPHTPAGFQMSLKQKEAAIEFHFESGKSKWKQIIRSKKSPAGNILSFWVITNGNDLVIDKHIDEGFPVEEDGSILLWEDKKVRYAEIAMNSPFRL